MRANGRDVRDVHKTRMGFQAMTNTVVHNMRDVPNCHSLPPSWHTLHEELFVGIFLCTKTNVHPVSCTHGKTAAGGSNMVSILREGPVAKLLISDWT